MNTLDFTDFICLLCLLSVIVTLCLKFERADSDSGDRAPPPPSSLDELTEHVITKAEELGFHVVSTQWSGPTETSPAWVEVTLD